MLTFGMEAIWDNDSQGQHGLTHAIASTAVSGYRTQGSRAAQLDEEFCTRSPFVPVMDPNED